MSIIRILQEAETAEDFICAVADLGDPKSGSCEDWDDTDMRDTMEAIISRARAFEREIDTSRGILLNALAEAEDALCGRSPDKRLSALTTVRHALKNG